MDNKMMKIFMMILLASLLSCSEEISKELKEASEGQSVDTGAIETLRKMEIINTADPSLSHFLHLEGDSSKPCEVSAPSAGWRADDYFRANATDCVLEVEELDLFRNGTDIRIHVDPGLCEYVTYTPLRFANYQPGKTTRTQYTFACDTMCAEREEDLCTRISDKVYDTFSLDTVLDANVDPFYGEVLTPHTCKFDYSDEGEDGPNCDDGKIETIQYNLTSYERQWCDGGDINLEGRAPTSSDCEVTGGWITGVFSCSIATRVNRTDCETTGVWTAGPDTCDITGRVTQLDCESAGAWAENPHECSVDPINRASELLCTAVGVVRNFDCKRNPDIVHPNQIRLIKDSSGVQETLCGGSQVACFDGPGVDIVEDPESANGVITQNGELAELNLDYKTVSPFSEGKDSNMYVSSYQRTCTSDVTKLDFESSGVNFNGSDFELFGRYYGDNNLYGHTDPFNPFFVEKFPTTSIDADNNGSVDYVVYGTHPFMSIKEDGESARSNTSSYYSVRCLDQSKDVKAQIRLHVREWDREFTKENVYHSRISDLNTPGVALMDSSGIHDGDQYWNDISDWDDFWDGSNVYTNNNCREVDKHNANGTCYMWVGGLKVINPAITNSALCLALPVGPANCSNNANVTRTSCINAGAEWIDSLWESDDQSGANFPRKI